MRQIRFNPELIESLAPTKHCLSCGDSFTPRNFELECPTCIKMEHIIEEEWFGKKKQKKYRQEKLL